VRLARDSFFSSLSSFIFSDIFSAGVYLDLSGLGCIKLFLNGDLYYKIGERLPVSAMLAGLDVVPYLDFNFYNYEDAFV
jgi:hypothetical protein